jgi:TonB-linked SusC/RagA family outer membrane protein
MQICHLMRVGLLSIVFASCMAGTLYAKPAKGQEVLTRKVSLVADQEQLKVILREIGRAADVKFIYVSPGIPDRMKVTLLADRDDLSIILNRLLSPYHISYEVVGKQIILKPMAPSAIRPDSSAPGSVTVATQKPITGQVADANGNPLAGVSITVKGTSTGSSTNDKGQFRIDAPKNAELEISYVGYASQTIRIGDRTDISVILIKVENSLNEVVVVGYGTQRKVDLTGSVSTVSATQLENRPVTSLDNALAGTMPGVTVIQNNGQPGRDAASININGIGTLNSTTPLVVVDGVISSMYEVNPNDVESMSVLKDAASAAIYGSRAANGVILVTTKKGKKSGPAQIEYDAYIGKQTPTRLPDYLPSWQAATMYNQALTNVGSAPVYSATDIQEYKDGSDPIGHPNTNWLGLFYNGNGLQQNHYLGVSGGSDKTQYLFSLGYFDQEGNVQKTQAQRYTTRLNLSSQVTSRLRAYANISYTFNPFQEPLSSYPGVSAFSQMIRQVNRISPTVPLKWGNGDYAYIGDGNPIAWLNSPSLGTYNHYLLAGSAGLDWEIIKDLHFKPMVGYTLTQDQNKSYVSNIQFYTSTGAPGLLQGPNSATDQYDNTTYITLQSTLDYTRKFGGHTFKLLGGYSQEYTKYYELDGYRQSFLNNDLSDLNAAPPTGETSGGYSNELALQSFFGRFNYDYEGRYLFEANLRYDGSSRFDTANRFGTFPSLSAGWRISQEAFFKPLKPYVSELKLRGSWGKLGNQNITGSNSDNTYYPYITTVAANQNYVLGGTNPAFAAGVAPINGANTALKWETTTETDLGLDAALLNEKLTFTADYFVKNTSNILLNIPVSAPYGLNTPYQNAGSVQNKGWEFSAGYHGRQGAFTYNISANAAFIKNEVTSLDGTGPNISGITIQKVGLPINSFWGYQAEGLFQNQQQVTAHATQSPNTGPGDIIYKDQNGDGTIDQTNDRVYLGTYFPKVTFGFNLGAGYKGIDLTAFFQGAAGVKGYAEGIAIGQVGTTVGKPTSAMLDSWTATNPGAKFPRLLTTSYLQNDPGTNPSSYWVRNAGYVRMKNLQLGYTLPRSIAQRIGAQRIRVYYSGQNLLTFSQFYKWIDPEAPAGTAGYDYPQVKTTTFGLNITF